MTMLVKVNIVSVSDSHQPMIGRPFSPIIDSEMAKSAKTTICSTSLCAIASMIDSGTVCRRIWSHVCGVAEIAGGPDGGGSDQADAGFQDVDGEQPDDQRERGDDLEVDDRAQAHAADGLGVPGAGDARDQRRRR